MLQIKEYTTDNVNPKCQRYVVTHFTVVSDWFLSNIYMFDVNVSRCYHTDHVCTSIRSIAHKYVGFCCILVKCFDNVLYVPKRRQLRKICYMTLCVSLCFHGYRLSQTAVESNVCKVQKLIKYRLTIS